MSEVKRFRPITDADKEDIGRLFESYLGCFANVAIIWLGNGEHKNQKRLKIATESTFSRDPQYLKRIIVVERKLTDMELRHGERFFFAAMSGKHYFDEDKNFREVAQWNRSEGLYYYDLEDQP